MMFIEPPLWKKLLNRIRLLSPINRIFWAAEDWCYTQYWLRRKFWMRVADKIEKLVIPYKW
ncbi:MAG TPA: hypothetical protein ENF38_00595 [Candidatus Aenigmarchaeota archaeon]|nr:hypothetical protein [Candidatus Aenigmarchaeota archaeon]